MINMDLETRSRADVTQCGVYRFIEDPTLDLLGICSRIGGGELTQWRGAFADFETAESEDPTPDDLLDAIEDGEPVYAWNAAFERLVWNAVAKRHDWPQIRIEQTVCLAAWARCFNLPSKLGFCAARLLPPDRAKLTDVAKGVQYMWRVDKPLERPGDMDLQMEYCARDVEAMEEIYALLPNVTGDFLEGYWASEHINDRGCMVDMDLVAAASRLKPRVDLNMTKELTSICGDVKLRGPSFLHWLEERLPDDLQSTLDINVKRRVGLGWRTDVKRSANKVAREQLRTAIEERPDMGEIRRALTVFEEANRAAVTKYAAADKRVSDDGCLRGQFMFAGAAQTQRWSSHGMQLHNMIRDVPENAEDLIWRIHNYHDPVVLEAKLAMTVNQALSRILRTAFVAEDGKVLVWGDWSAIEARMLPWLADDPRAERVLDVFRAGDDIYIIAAQEIFPGQEIDKAKRQIGKVSVLSCGYQGGVGAFQAMAANYGVKVSDERALEIVQAWRQANRWAVEFWRHLEDLAIAAIEHPETLQEVGRVSFLFVPDLLRGSLLAFLPSGKTLTWPEASVQMVEKFGSERPTVVFNHPVFGMSDTYGGKLCENLSQAESASLLRAKLIQLKDEAVLHVHDEIVLETDDPEPTAARLKAIMEAPEPWSTGLPLDAEVEWGSRYKVPFAKGA